MNDDTNAKSPAFLSAGGAMGALMRSHDWSGSPLGSPERWPQSLRSVVGLALASKFPMFVAWGPQLGFLYNDGYAPILGAKHPGALGRPFQEIWPEIWNDIRPLVARALAGEATFHEDLPLTMLRNGYEEQTWFTFSYSPVWDESGAIAGMFCACTETTAKVLAERRQRFILDLGDRLRDLRDPVIITATAAEMLGRHLGVAQVGYAEVDVGGEHITIAQDWSDGRVPSVVGRHRLAHFGEGLVAALRAGKAITVADVREDERTRSPAVIAAFEGVHVRAVLAVPLIKEGRLVATLFLHHPEPRTWTAADITLAGEVGERTWAAVERARAEREVEATRVEAERANLAKSKFLAAASHDLRQPMQSLLLFLQVLQPHVAPKGQEALKHLGRGLDALRDLLDSLLDISRLDAGVVVPSVEDFAVGQVVEQIGAAYTPIAAAKGLTLHVEPCTVVVRSDRTLLGRMVRNLVENALRYTETGRIAIECHEAGGRLRVEVHDTGIGIPTDHLERIWEEFHQVGNPERDRNRGLGLGLAIVQRLSGLLAHPVTVRSRPGEGSVFVIEVPLGQAAPRTAAAAVSEVVGNGRFAVLVDDDAIVLLGLKATFEAWGYEVLAAGSADQAMARLRERGRRPDVVVADYRLREGRSGTEAILAVRAAHGADIPGIILTGETGAEVQSDAAQHDLGVIHKPVTPRQLGAALGKLLTVR